VTARKARSPAAAGTARGARGSSEAGKLKRPEATPYSQTDCLAVYDGRTCLGFLLPRGKQGVEAFDADDHLLGLFPEHSAAAAIFERGAAS
jgi:hypothetical protein